MLKLEIVTPEKRVFDAEVDSVTVPTASGEAGILPNHAPLISAVKPGILSYAIKGVTDKLAVSGGFVEVNSQKVSVLVDSAETADEIDVDAARTLRESVEKSIQADGLVSSDNSDEKQEALDHASSRLQLAAGK